MSPQELQAVLAVLEPILAALTTVGLPGLMVLLFSAPALVIVAILVMSHAGSHRMEKAQLQFQHNMQSMLDAYREDTQGILREIGSRHAEVVQYYHKNAELVKNYERVTEALQSLVVNNTRAVERLTTIIESMRK